MSTINISEADTSLYNQFIEGKPVEVKAVSIGNERDFRKGTQVTISHLNMQASAKVVSDPVLIQGEGEEKKVFSLIVEKAD